MSLGVLAAAQLAWPALNFDIPWLTFSRIRSNHTFGVIFAFGGSALMGTCYYVVQRTCHVRLALGGLARFTFWGWQLAVLLAMTTMPFGITQSKEYAEPEWFIDLIIAVVWVSFAVVFFATLLRRRIQHIYVANWYYGAFIIAVRAAAHRQQSRRAGVVDQVVSGSIRARSTHGPGGGTGHNAVAFFLTAASSE
jgi:cytochrome c oxidase cbb3-type subunit 1